jgi:hypothetical protein
VSGPASTGVSDFGARSAETVPTLRSTPWPAAKLVVDRASSIRLLRTIQEYGGRRGMLPLYTTRIEDLAQGDFVKVDWSPAFNVALLTPEALLRQRFSPAVKVLDLKDRLLRRGRV